MRTRGDRIYLQRFFRDQQACTVLRQDTHKILLRAHNQGKRGEDFFIKIYRYPHLIRSRMADWKFVGGGHEYRMCKKLNTLGVATPEPIGFAVDRNFMGYARQSLYASQWLNDSQTLDAWIRNVNHHPSISKESRQTILYALGRFVGTLHHQLINAKDLNTKNLLVKMHGQGAARFFLVDYERITFLKKHDLTRFMNGLSQLGAGLIPGCEDAVEWICRGYVTIHPDVEKEDLVQRVTQASHDKIREWRQEMDGFFARIGDEMHRRKDQERQ